MNFNADEIKLKAYAKINLSLYITGTRQDGYHLLDSVFLPVSIYDEITVKKSVTGISIKCGKNIPADKRNTAYKAAKLVMEAAGTGGAEIKIRKNIPIMAGLGGGSADAAAVLIGMNELYKLDMNKEKLAGIGLEIGADVPFFLGTVAARVRGIGEMVTPLEINKPIHMVIIKPEADLSTADVYRKYDEISNGGTGDCGKLIAALDANDLSGAAGLLHNDLQPAAELLCPDIKEAAEFLWSNGAFAAMMTGSGSCVFGIYDSESAARAAAGRYSGCGKAYAARSVNRPVIKVV